MADLSSNMAGITSPNPFWLASSPATHRADQVLRAFEHGWGGAVWHTVHAGGVLVPSGRYAVLPSGTDRVGALAWTGPVLQRSAAEVFSEFAHVKQAFPNRALLCSVAGADEDELKALVKRALEAGADGVELYLGDAGTLGETMDRTEWTVDAAAGKPVLVKLAARHDVNTLARSAVQAGAAGISAVDGLPGLPGVDLWGMRPVGLGRARIGGGALKPWALQAVASLARDEEVARPISGGGGIRTWQDAAEFLAIGATVVQVCSAAITQGVHIVADLVEGLSDHMDETALANMAGLVGRAWKFPSPEPGAMLARIDASTCIGCGLCVAACSDGSVDCIRLLQPGDASFAAHAHALSSREGAPPATRVPVVDTVRCVGCGLCQGVCPVPGCVAMVDAGH